VTVGFYRAEPWTASKQQKNVNYCADGKIV